MADSRRGHAGTTSWVVSAVRNCFYSLISQISSTLLITAVVSTAQILYQHSWGKSHASEWNANENGIFNNIWYGNKNGISYAHTVAFCPIKQLCLMQPRSVILLAVVSGVMSNYLFHSQSAYAVPTSLSWDTRNHQITWPAHLLSILPPNLNSFWTSCKFQPRLTKVLEFQLSQCWSDLKSSWTKDPP